MYNGFNIDYDFVWDIFCVLKRNKSILIKFLFAKKI